MEHTKLVQLIEQASIKLHDPVHDILSLNQWKTQMFSLINEIARMKLPSSSLSVSNRNRSLDPADWLSTRRLAHDMLDSSLDYVQFIRDRPVWQPIPIEVQTMIEYHPLPENGQSLASVCHEALAYIIPYTMGNAHPRFWGWVFGEGTLGGILADMIAATINASSSGGANIPTFVERTVIQWMRQLFGFPSANIGGGLVVTGTSMATVISMAVARQRVLANVRQDGIVNGSQLVVYASTETHICVVRALELLGLGSKAMHYVAVDENFCIKICQLKAAILDDRNKGLIPFCIIGNAGTVNTGAFDDLFELSSIARLENMWFHVDGAFGSLVILDPRRRHLVSGIDQADSLAFDFHKWLHCPYDAGCVLIRDSTLLKSTFSINPSYLATTERGCTNNHPFFDMGPELSRTFRALKPWFILKEHGTAMLGQKIAENCEQAQYLVSLLEKHRDLIRIVRPVSLNIVNFRLEPKELSDVTPETINVFNSELVDDIQLSGIAVPSITHIRDQIYIRVAVTSHRSTLEDFNIFIDTLLNLCTARLRAYVSKENEKK